MKANRNVCYNAGTIFDSISSEPQLWLKRGKNRCHIFSNEESTTMQIAHEELNDVDDPTEEINRGWIMIKKTTR